MTAEDQPARFGPPAREVRAYLELFALTGVAFVQPLLDSLRRNSNDIFVAGANTRLQTLALLAIVLFVPSAVLWAVEVAVGVVLPRVRRFVHAGLAGAIFGVLVVEILAHNSGLGGGARTLVAIVAGAAAAVLLLRFDVARLYLRYLALAPVIFAILFVLSAQVSPLVTSSGVAKASIKVRRPDRVVMVVLDELPLQSLLDGTGHVDAGLFPNIAKLAAGSTWYRNNTSVAPYTTVAVPAILTGDYPTKPAAIATAAVYPHNLFTLLGGTYHINSHENLEALNPSGDAEGPTSLRTLMDQSIDLWKRFVTDSPLPTKISADQYDLEAPAVNRFVASLGSAKDKQLDYLHVLLPHFPWHLLPDGRSYTDEKTTPGLLGTWGAAELAAVGRQREVMQLQAADHLVGAIIDKLQRLGVYKRSLVVLTADHGEGFTAQNPIREATPANFTQVMWVPLFVKAPGQTAGRIDDRLSHSIDVLPTIADELGAKIPWKIDGRSLLKPALPNGPRRFLEISSPDAQKPPAEAKYKSWDGIRGFAQVLASRAALPGTDQSLRVYKGFSKFGDLVGQAAAPIVESGASAITGSLSQPGQFADVRPSASYTRPGPTCRVTSPLPPDGTWRSASTAPSRRSPRRSPTRSSGARRSSPSSLRRCSGPDTTTSARTSSTVSRPRPTWRR